MSVFRTLSALSTFPDRTSSFRMQIVFVSSDVKSKQLSEKITSSSISNHTNGAKQSALICISIVLSFFCYRSLDLRLQKIHSLYGTKLSASVLVVPSCHV